MTDQEVFEKSQKEGAEEFGILWLSVQRAVLQTAEEQGFSAEENKAILSSTILNTMREMKERCKEAQDE